MKEGCEPLVSVGPVAGWSRPLPLHELQGKKGESRHGLNLIEEAQTADRIRPRPLLFRRVPYRLGFHRGDGQPRDRRLRPLPVLQS